MNQEITICQFNDHKFQIIIDENGKPQWIAKEICEYFGDSHYRRSVSRLSLDEKGVSLCDTAGGKQNMTTINESGLWHLLLCMRPQKKKTMSEYEYIKRVHMVEDFRHWITHEVLPSIFKTGSYSIGTTATLDMIIGLAQSQKQALERIGNVELRLDKYETNQQTVTALLASVKEVSTRLKISQIVRGYAEKNKVEYKACWDKLYYEFKYRYSIDLTQRAKNSGKSRLDIAEELNCLDDLFALAVSLFMGNN